MLFRIADLRQLQLDITLSGEKAARLRFFMSSGHTEEQIRTTVRALQEESART